MESFSILLREREERHLLSGLGAFADGLLLYLQVGYDLHYSWSECLRGLETEISPRLVEFLKLDSSEGLAEHLEKLADTYPVVGQRVWFSVLLKLYQSGASLGPAVQAMARGIRLEQDRKIEAFCRELPTRLNVTLIVFFLPPTLALLFYPLIIEIITQF